MLRALEVVTAAATLVQPAPARLPDSAADRLAGERFAARVDSLRRAAGIPGLALAVVRDTSVVIARGFGRTEVGGGRPVTPDTPFNIASVSKPISAVVALALVELGKLDLDRPMASYRDFPEFCADVSKAGGIFFRDFACADPKLTLRHLLSMQANGPPGTRFLYNPPAYSWTSRPMAEVAGLPFSELVRRLVFEPARMTRSARTHRALPLRADLAAELARPHRVDSAGRAVPSTPPPPQGDGAAGGVVSTAMDLARFDIELGRGRLVSPGSLAAMWSPGRDPAGAVLPYGLGWFIGSVGGTRVVWHTGLWEERYSALYLRIPDRKLALILLANSDGLRWPTRLDEAAVERSAFARAFFEAFPR